MSISNHLRSWHKGAQHVPVHPLRLCLKNKEHVTRTSWSGLKTGLIQLKR